MNLRKLPLANLSKSPARTAGFIVLVALLSFAVYAGTLVVSSLNSGLSSLEARLGADIVVAPQTARSKFDLQEVLVEGIPKSFYMDRAYIDKIAAIKGVEKVSPQYFLATLKAGCCSFPVQVIGFDPETDFTIKPWVARSYSNDLSLDEVVAGCNISGAVGETITLYGVPCTIVSKLDETGTSLDNAVYATNDTLVHLIDGSSKMDHAVLEGTDPESAISLIQVKVENGYNVEDVTNDINIHVRGVWAVQLKTMTSDVSDSIAGTATVISGLVACIWLLAVIVLVVAFTIIGRSRVKEFAILRVMGASRRALARIVVTEALFVSGIGALAGVALGALVVVGFNGALESALGLPFLLPDAAAMAAWALAAIFIAVLMGCAASAISAIRLSKVDPGQTLREE